MAKKGHSQFENTEAVFSPPAEPPIADHSFLAGAKKSAEAFQDYKKQVERYRDDLGRAEREFDTRLHSLLDESISGLHEKLERDHIVLTCREGARTEIESLLRRIERTVQNRELCANPQYKGVWPFRAPYILDAKGHYLKVTEDKLEEYGPRFIEELEDLRAQLSTRRRELADEVSVRAEQLLEHQVAYMRERQRNIPRPEIVYIGESVGKKYESEYRKVVEEFRGLENRRDDLFKKYEENIQGARERVKAYVARLIEDWYI